MTHNPHSSSFSAPSRLPRPPSLLLALSRSFNCSSPQSSASFSFPCPLPSAGSSQHLPLCGEGPRAARQSTARGCPFPRGHRDFGLPSFIPCLLISPFLRYPTSLLKSLCNYVFLPMLLTTLLPCPPIPTSRGSPLMELHLAGDDVSRAAPAPGVSPGEQEPRPASSTSSSLAGRGERSLALSSAASPPLQAF